MYIILLWVIEDENEERTETELAALGKDSSSVPTPASPQGPTLYLLFDITCMLVTCILGVLQLILQSFTLLGKHVLIECFSIQKAQPWVNCMKSLFLFISRFPGNISIHNICSSVHAIQESVYFSVIHFWYYFLQSLL